MLDRLKKVDNSLEPHVRVLHLAVILMIAAFLANVLLHDSRPASRGGLVLLMGVLITLGISARPSTTRRYLQRVREASRDGRFWWRLIGFVVVAVGHYLILSAKSATFLEEIFSAVILIYVWTYNVLQNSEG